jgi:4-hydroxybenzoate polyprenyltransferase
MTAQPGVPTAIAGPPTVARPSARASQLVALFHASRPRQWVKNLVVLAPLVFARSLFSPAAVTGAVAAFLVFCALSSAVYLLNDLRDLEADRLHPRKRLRPLASGQLAVSSARVAMAMILAAAGAGALWLGWRFSAAAAAYVLLNVAYSFGLKHVVLVDVFALAFGFVLRVVGGSVVVGVLPSPFLLLCTLFLALFLALGKRRHEINTLADAHLHRRSLAEYSTAFIDQMVGVVAAITVTTYALYTISDVTVARFGTDRLIYTVPFVLFGIFRYLYLVYRREGGDRPEHALMTDGTLLGTVLLWGLVSIAILYSPR